MGIRSIAIKAADDYAGNSDGTHYKATKQVTTNQSYVMKVSLYAPTTAAGNVYIWLLDTAAGDANSHDPKHVRLLAPGLSDTWDLGPGGSLFKNGIYVVVSTTDPATPATKPTAAADDQCIVVVDFRG